jgi:uncharacterized membrane protein
MKTSVLSQTILIAAIYTTLTVIIAPFSFGFFQVRISEALTPLPFLLGPAGVYGLFLGCFISNLFSPYGLADIVIGSLSTLVAAWISYKSSHLIMACISPVLINSIFIGYLLHNYGAPLELSMLSVGIGETIACIFLGYPLAKGLEKRLPRAQ